MLYLWLMLAAAGGVVQAYEDATGKTAAANKEAFRANVVSAEPRSLQPAAVA